MRMKRVLAVAAGLALVLLWALAGPGEDLLGISGRGESLRLALLRTPEVRKELKITAPQARQIESLTEEAKETKKQLESASKGQEKAKSDNPLAKQAEEQAKAVVTAQLEQLAGTYDRRLEKVLTAPQRERLRQIVLRVEGPSAFLTPELIKALNINPIQVEEIRAILTNFSAVREQSKEARKQANDLLKGSADFDLEKVRKEQGKTQERAESYSQSRKVMAQIGRVLTRRQRDRYNAMLGPSFELTKLTDREGRPLFDASFDLAAALLRHEAVRVELDLTKPQIQRLDDRVPYAKVLDPAQKTRLSQIALQGEGPAALVRPEVIRSLRLRDDQVSRIREALMVLSDDQRQLRDAEKEQARRLPPGGDDPAQEEARKEQEKARLRSSLRRRSVQAVGQMESILTARQRSGWKAMLGEPFDFSSIGLRPVDPGAKKKPR